MANSNDKGFSLLRGKYASQKAGEKEQASSDEEDFVIYLNAGQVYEEDGKVRRISAGKVGINMSHVEILPEEGGTSYQNRMNYEKNRLNGWLLLLALGMQMKEQQDVPEMTVWLTKGKLNPASQEDSLCTKEDLLDFAREAFGDDFEAIYKMVTKPKAKSRGKSRTKAKAKPKKIEEEFDDEIDPEEYDEERSGAPEMMDGEPDPYPDA